MVNHEEVIGNTGLGMINQWGGGGDRGVIKV